MVGEFQWMDIFTNAGWPFWVVAGCNSLIIALLFEGLFFMWKPLCCIVRKRFHRGQNVIMGNEWESFLFRELKRVHTVLPMIRALIMISPMIGILGGVVHIVHLIQGNGLEIFYEHSMQTYLAIRGLFPLVAGFCSALSGMMLLTIYVNVLKILVRNYPRFCRVINS